MVGDRRLQRIRGRHQIVVAYLALFVALGGSAVAAKPLIDSADVQDESLTTADIRNDSLTGDDILESSLGKVSSATTADSATTAGDAGTLDGMDSTNFLADSGVPGKIVRRSETREVPAKSFGSEMVFCLPGERVVGGGVGFGSADVINWSANEVMSASRPGTNGGRDIWFGASYNGTGITRTLVVSAICVTP